MDGAPNTGMPVNHQVETLMMDVGQIAGTSPEKAADKAKEARVSYYNFRKSSRYRSVPGKPFFGATKP